MGIDEKAAEVVVKTKESEAGGTLRRWMRKGSGWELDDGRDILTRAREHILASGGVTYERKEKKPAPSGSSHGEPVKNSEEDSANR